MLPAVRDLDVPVVLVNVQKKRAPDYEHTDTATWLGELYACGAVGEMAADLDRAGKSHAVITGVMEGGDPRSSGRSQTGAGPPRCAGASVTRTWPRWAGPIPA